MQEHVIEQDSGMTVGRRVRAQLTHNAERC